jgi:hypothetical protein
MNIIHIHWHIALALFTH